MPTAAFGNYVAMLRIYNPNFIREAGGAHLEKRKCWGCKDGAVPRYVAR